MWLSGKSLVLTVKSVAAVPAQLETKLAVILSIVLASF